MNKHFVINRKVLISMLFIATTFLGYISYKQLDMEIFPNADLPMLYVQVSSNLDMTPEYMEQEAIIPIESAVASLENIEEIESTADRRSGSVLISYEKRTDLKYAYLKLDERIAVLRGTLSDEFNLQVRKVDLESTSNILMTIQALGEGGVDRVRNFVDQYISPELINVEGVAAVNVFGGRQKSVEIILNREMCEAYHISPNRVRNVLSSNMNVRQYAGMIKEEGYRYFAYMNAEYQDITQIEDLVIGTGFNSVQLKDIAEIFYGERELESISRTNGMDAVSLQIVHDAQANIIDLSHALQERVEDLNDENVANAIELIIQEDTAEIMEDNIDQIIQLALIGGLLAVFILWIFLRNFKLVTVVALAMPVSVFTAFNFFYAADISINSLTLMGIALAVGMLLDTSVVVLENIYRLRSRGVGKVESVVNGTREVWRAIVASTLTTVAVFIPFSFASEFLIQLLGKNIGVSIISTLLVSLFVSLLLIPMLVYLVISSRRSTRTEIYQKVGVDDKGIRFYLALLKTALRNPGATILIVVVLFFSTIVISMTVSVNQLSEVETDQITLYVTMNTGTTLETTDELVAQIEEIVMAEEEVDQVISNIEDEEATVTIKLKEDFEAIKKRTFGAIQEDVLEKVEDLPADDISTSASSSGGGFSGAGGGRNSGGSGFQRMLGIGEDEEYLVLKGQDFNLMVEVAQDLETYIEDLDNINSVRLSIRENQPEVHLDLNSLLMSEYGITLTEVRSELGGFQNEISSGVNFRQGSEEYEIVITYNDAEEEEEDKTIEELRELAIPDAEDQGTYELQQISDVFFARGMREISRINQEKQIELRYSYIGDVYDSNDLLEFARNEIQDVIDEANIPAGIAVELVQEDSGLDEFKMLFIVALLLVYMILATLFESFITPFVILLSIPLAAIGSFFMLTITGNSLFNANTLMGFLILLGVVVNNAIILIDFMNLLRKQGYRKNRAIMLGGMSRVRPILITTITTCVAMMPLALGKSEYVEAIGPPFAITVIGGLSVSTLLTLVFIPMLYNGLEQAVRWFMDLKIVVRIILILLIAGGIILVKLNADEMIWRIAGVLLVFAGVPLAYWFVSSSLRKAQEKIIPDDEDLHIEIANLVKIYGRRNKVVREFASGRRMDVVYKRNDKLQPNYRALIWQLPLLAFLIYFSWIYLVSSFWQLITSVIVYLYLLSIINSFRKYFPSKWLVFLNKLITYTGPLIVSIMFFKKWDNLGLSIFVGILWYLILAVYVTSTGLKKGTLVIEKVKKIFRWFVKLVQFIPGIGSQRDEFKALKGVSLEIGTGMFGLLGPNGAGKSTMIRIICGILEQSYGKIWINGIDTQEKREELQGLIGYLPQEFGMYENMSAESYLDYQAILKGITNAQARETRIKEVLDSVHMWESRKKKIGEYSGGMKQRIGIAQVLLHLPRILVVDEPTAGLDPRERIRFRNLLVELSRSRIVIFSTHIIEDISSSCRTMAVINRGEVVYTGTPAEMTRIATGKVWRANLDVETFDEKTKDMLVIHHMRDQKSIRARLISEDKPFENAVEEIPLLEDAYLWLLRRDNRETN
ncbi:efflux RND transporter permease subunit [Bacteroidota bacterium]